MNAHGPAYRAGLRRFRRGEAGRGEARDVVRHLLTGCAECAAETSRLWPSHAHSAETGDSPPCRSTAVSAQYDYSAAFARADRTLARHQDQFAEERAAVERLRRELKRHPRSRQEVLAENSARFQTWALVESLIEDCRRLCQADTEEAAHLARLAVRLSDRLDKGRYGRERICDLRARSWGTLANILRVQEHYRESEQAFARARQLLRKGTGDPVEKAALLSLEASVCNDRRRFDRAFALLDQAIAIARRMGETELWTRALVKKAKHEVDRGMPEEALSLLLEAQKHLDAVSHQRLAATLQHNILYALIQAGRFEEAAAGLPGTRALYRQVDLPLDRIRLGWLEGRILQGLGRLDEAESHLRHALDAMLAEGLDYDAALVGLELAVLYSEQNRNAEIRELVAAMLPVFESHQIHREALAALVVFRDAVVRESLSTELVQDFAEYMRRAAGEPHLRFSFPADVATR